MTPRERRLVSDLRHMEELAAAGVVTFRAEGTPPELYHVMFAAPGLAVGADGRLVVRHLHRCSLYLHLDYPRRPPVVTWQTPVFHPNLLPPERNGGVCLGSWSAAETVGDVCRRLLDLITYRAFNPDDALNAEAAAWARRSGMAPGADLAAMAGESLPREVVVAAGVGR